MPGSVWDCVYKRAPTPNPSWKSSRDKMAPAEFIPSGQQEEDGGICGFYPVLQETCYRLYFWKTVQSALSDGSHHDSYLKDMSLWKSHIWLCCWKKIHLGEIIHLVSKNSFALTLILPMPWRSSASIEDHSDPDSLNLNPKFTTNLQYGFY